MRIGWRTWRILEVACLAVPFLSPRLPAPPRSSRSSPAIRVSTILRSSRSTAGSSPSAPASEGPTHGAIRVKTSPDGIAWTDAGVIGDGPPAWAKRRSDLSRSMSGALGQPARRHGLPLLLPVELRGQRERDRAHDQQAFDPTKPGEGWQDQGMVADVEARRRLQRHRPVSDRCVGRARLPRLRLVLVRDQAQRAQSGDRQAHPRGCAPHRACQPTRGRDRGLLDPRA